MHPTSCSLSPPVGGYASLALTDAASPMVRPLTPATSFPYTTLFRPWDLTGLGCVSSLGTSTFTTTAPPVAGPGTATASITLAANDTVTCTFTDTGRAHV